METLKYTEFLFLAERGEKKKKNKNPLKLIREPTLDALVYNVMAVCCRLPLNNLPTLINEQMLNNLNSERIMKTNALEYLKHQHCQFRLSEHILSSAYPVIAQIMEEYADLSTNQANDAEQSTSNCNIPLVSHRTLPDGYKVYECCNCKTINVKRDNGEIRVGFCDECDHPLWN